MELLGIAADVLILIFLLTILTILSIAAFILNKKDKRCDIINFKEIKRMCEYNKKIEIINNILSTVCMNSMNNSLLRICKAIYCPVLKEINKKSLDKNEK